MVLESGIPELVDLEALVSDYWLQVQRPWLAQNYSGLHRQVIYRAGDLRNVVEAGFSDVHWAMGQYNKATIDYLRFTVIGAIGAKIEAQAGILTAGLTRADLAHLIQAVPGKVWGEVPWLERNFDLVYQETTRNRYREDPGTETLRGMVSAMRWELTVGSRDRQTGFLSGVFGDIAGIPGAVAAGLAGSFQEAVTATTEAVSASQEAIWGLLQETQANLGEAMTGIFGTFFQEGGILATLLGGLPMLIARIMQGSLDDVAGMFLSSLQTRSPENVAALNNYLESEGQKRGFWPVVQKYKVASPDTVFDVAKKLKDSMATQLIAVNMASVMAEVLLPYESGVSRAVPQLWETLIDARDAIGSFTGPILEAALQEPMRQWAMRRWLPSIPGPMDLIRMYVREAFLEWKQVNIPAGFREDMRLHGYADRWTELWWGAHWELPPIALLYEFYHRFPQDFTEQDLRQYLEWWDFHPREHDWLIRAAETLIPRVDLRRAYEYGDFDEREIVRRYSMLGFGPADAETMGRIAVRFTLQAEINDIRRQHERRYLLGLEDDDEFREALKPLGFGPGVVEKRLEYVRVRRATELEIQAKDLAEEPRKRQLTVTQLGRALRYGRISSVEYRERLVDAGFLPEDARILEARELEDPLADEHERLEREVLRTRVRQYQAMFRNEAIDQVTFLTNLLALGVPEELAMATVDLEVARKLEPQVEEESAEEKATRRRIRTMRSQTAREQYRRWLIDKDDLVDVLLSLEYDADEARAVADYEEIRRPDPPVDPALAAEEERRLELQRLNGAAELARFRAEEIDAAGLRSALERVGYDPLIAEAKARLEVATLPKPVLTEEEKDALRAEERARKLREQVARQMYRDWILDEDDLRDALLGIPLDSSVVQAIVDLERARRPEQPIAPEEKERLKHEAEVRKWAAQVVREQYRKKAITREALEAELVDSGYPADIAFLITEYEVYHRLPKPK